MKLAPPPEKIDTNPSDTRTKIGLLYFERGDFDRAATEFNLVLGAEPDNYRVHYYLGTAYTELTDYEKAVEGVRENSRRQRALRRIAPAARLHLRQAKRVRSSAYRAQPGASEEAQRHRDSRLHGRRLPGKEGLPDRDQAGAADGRARAEERQVPFHARRPLRREQAAPRQYRGDAQAIELNPKNAQALNYLGYTYAEDGNHLDEAERLVKRALAIEPEDGFYVDSLGWVYYQKGEYGKAAEQLEKAVNLTGDDPTITEHLGDAYSKLGRAEQAGQQYEDALRRSTDQEQVARLKEKLQALRNVGSASH